MLGARGWILQGGREGGSKREREKEGVSEGGREQERKGE